MRLTIRCLLILLLLFCASVLVADTYRGNYKLYETAAGTIMLVPAPNLAAPTGSVGTTVLVPIPRVYSHTVPRAYYTPAAPVAVGVPVRRFPLRNGVRCAVGAPLLRPTFLVPGE